MRFLGTSGGEGIPAPFCHCEVCNEARRLGGRELRLRSGFRIDERNAIDLGCDTIAACQKSGEDLYALRNVFYSHTHNDHFSYDLYWTRSVSTREKFPIKLWFSPEGMKYFEESLFKNAAVPDAKAFMGGSNVEFGVITPGEETDCGDYLVTALKGRHRTALEVYSNNYIFKSKETGKTFFYALDTGIYSDENFELLRGYKFDTLITECTFPDPNRRSDTLHMSLAFSLDFADKLYEMGCIDEKSGVYFTHIAPVCMGHNKLCEYVAALDKPYKINIAYDGMYIEE